MIRSKEDITMKSKYFILAFVLLFCQINAADDDKKAEAATAPPPPPIKPTDLICKTCDCTAKGVVDCQGKALDKYFSIADWMGVKEKSPTKLIMSYNNFTNVTQMSELDILVLDLSHGNISHIQRAAFLNLQSMMQLDLGYNNLTSAALRPDVFLGKYMPEEYQPLRSMRVLRLSHNQLHSLDQDLFEHLPEVEELYLDGNPLALIDHVTVIAISSLTYLKVLDLSGCQLKSLPEFFLHTPRYLERLDISNNSLQKIPPALEEAKSLKFLSVSRNPIKYVEKDSENYSPFPTLPHLQELHMCYMPSLQAIKERSMAGLIGLEKLYLNHNPALSFIDATAFERKDDTGEGEDWPMIKVIYLDHNNLSTIDSGLLGRWDLVTTIDIQENPYLCDCSTQWMVSTLAHIVRAISPNLTSDIICQEPIEMRGKSMIHLEEIHRHMRCVDAYSARPEKDAAVLIGVVIGVLLAVPVVLMMMLLYKRGYFASCGVSGPAAFSRTFYKRTGTDDVL